MPKFFSLEKPPKRKVEELVKELKEYPNLRPLLTFPFPTNKDREKALKMIESGKLDTELLVGLLESDDFVVRLSMLYLLEGKIHNLPEQERKKIAEKALPVLKKLAEDKDSWVRGQAIQALGKVGEKTLPLLEKLAEDKDSWVRQQAAIALGKVGEKALPVLKKLAEDKDFKVRGRVAIALGNVGEKALPLLEKLAEDKDSWVRGQAALALGKVGEKALPVLKKLAEDKDFKVRGRVAIALGNVGEKALPVLKKLVKDEDSWVRQQAIQVLGNVGEKALPVLEKLVKDEDIGVRGEAVIVLGKIGEKVLPLLEKLAEDENSWVRKQAILALNKIKDRSKSKLWLLATKKPLFATPYTKELAERILKIQEIAKEMKDKFGDRFIGIVILGSTAKGYATPTSDLDWGIIAKDIEVSNYFKKRAQDQKLSLCREHYIEVDEIYKAKTNVEILFYGLFFGDRKKLYEVQKNTLESITSQEWDRIRRIIMENELKLWKAAERFGINEEEMERIRVFSSLLRVPPPYDEALEIVRRRAGLSSSA